jgi:hypothetical protein
MRKVLEAVVAAEVLLQELLPSVVVVAMAAVAQPCMRRTAALLIRVMGYQALQAPMAVHSAFLLNLSVAVAVSEGWASLVLYPMFRLVWE